MIMRWIDELYLNYPFADIRMLRDTLPRMRKCLGALTLKIHAVIQIRMKTLLSGLLCFAASKTLTFHIADVRPRGEEVRPTRSG